MRILLVPVVISVLAAPVSAAPRAAVLKRPATLPAAVLRSLEVVPASVKLEGPGAIHRVIVTGITPTGAIDGTRKATYRIDNPKVARISADGVVTALADGDALLEVRLDGKSARARVQVRNSRAVRPVSFLREVMPVLGRGGCNQATCHAKQGGKAGFQLSVLAFDPDADHAALALQAGGRRVDRVTPENSLLLRKATMAIPHGGGIRFKPGAAEHRLLARWVAEGARFDPAEAALEKVEVTPAERVVGPSQEQQLLVTAVYADGSRRDVTALTDFKSDETAVADVDGSGLMMTGTLSGEAAVMARFMGKIAVARVSVPPAKRLSPDAFAHLPRQNFIDDLVHRKLQQVSVLPSEPCDDATYLRRVSIDLIGTLPTAEEARAFLEECDTERGDSSTIPAPKARQRLVEALLSRSEYADYWATRWSNLLLVNRDLLLPRGAYAFDRWLRDAFQSNLPFDQFARDVVTATGETYRDGPPNFFRALPKPEDLGKSVSQLFLGVRMECAQCHHHPFERWSQEDFYGFAAIFARVKQKSGYPEGYTSIIYNGFDGELKHPKTEKTMPPTALGGGELSITEGEDRREALARWLTAPENPFFARAIVNRVWGLMMGRGIVEPVDDFRVTNPATNEPLLDALAKDFVEHRYDLKHLLKTIAASAAYQRSSAARAGNARDTRNYARYFKKRMPAEVLLDAIGQVTGVPENFRGHPEGTRAIQMWDSRLDVDFLETFGRPVRQSVCECERPTEGSVPQMLHLMNSFTMQERLTRDPSLVSSLAKSTKSEDEIVQELYLSALSRYPTAEELGVAKAAFTREKVTRKQGVEDVLWALLNSAEFILNH